MYPRDKPRTHRGKELNAFKERRSLQSEIFCYAIAFIIDMFGIYIVDMRDLCPWVYFRPFMQTDARAIVTFSTHTHTYVVHIP